MSKANLGSDLIPLFKSIGLNQAKAAEAAKSPKTATVLKAIINNNPTVAAGLDEKRSGLIVALAGSLAKTEGVNLPERDYVVNKILDGKLKSVDQVSGMYRL
jgi:glutaminyl-tRNA synthetase